MSLAVSMRRFVSVSNMQSSLGCELIQRHIVFDVFRDERAVFLRYRFKIPSGKHWISCKISELLAIDYVTYATANHVSFEVGLNRRNGGRFIGFVVSDKF